METKAQKRQDCRLPARCAGAPPGWGCTEPGLFASSWVRVRATAVPPGTGFAEPHQPCGRVCDSPSSSLAVEGTAAFRDGTLALNFKPTLISVCYAAQDRKGLGEGGKQGRLEQTHEASLLSVFPLLFPPQFHSLGGTPTFLGVHGIIAGLGVEGSSGPRDQRVPLSRDNFSWARLLLALNIPRDGASPTSPGNLCQYYTTLIVKECPYI